MIQFPVDTFTLHFHFLSGDKTVFFLFCIRFRVCGGPRGEWRATGGHAEQLQENMPSTTTIAPPYQNKSIEIILHHNHAVYFINVPIHFNKCSQLYQISVEQ